LFVDYAGNTAEVIDPLTGEIHQAQVFVAALGASSYSYAEATWTQSLPDWIGAHTRAFAYLGGVPTQVVPDNLKSGVVKACLYDPEINRTYADMARHYGTAIVPARPRKPRDKAKVEVAVQVVERWILARLRNRRFFSLAELNQAIAELLQDLNGRVTRHLGASRRQLFEEFDQPALKALPATPYEYAEWKQRRATGPNTAALVAIILQSRPHPEQGFRSCIGILRLAKSHGSDRLEAACERALEIGAHSYSSINSILKNNLDRRATPKSSNGATDRPAIDHANIRGSRYFH
jgi:transposase